MIEHLAQNFNSAAEFNYSVHIDPELRFVYFNNPKSACTTIKASLNSSYARRNNKELVYTSIGDIHNRNKNFLLMPGQVGIPKFLALLQDDSVFKFCFVRDPLHRLASAYQSKITWKSGSLDNLALLAHRGESWRPSFEEFVALIASNVTLRDCDEHWRLQTKQLCTNIVNYSVIGTFETLDPCLNAILLKLFGTDGAIYDVREHFQGNASHSVKLLKDVAAETERLVHEAYAEDEKLYQHVVATQPQWLSHLA